MSNFDIEKSNKSFQEAVSWSLPAVEGHVVNKHTKPEQQVEIDDVQLFEERIKKRLARIKQQEDQPTYLTVKQIEEVQKQAYDEAYKLGYDEAYKKGTADSESYIQQQLTAEQGVLKQNAQQLQKCFNMLSKPLDDVDKEVEQQLTEMVFFFCNKILSHELSVDSAHVFDLVQQATSRLPVAQKQIVVHLNPVDIALLEQNDVCASDHGWTFDSDSSVTAGGCLIKTEVASIDLSLEKRLTEITDQLFTGLKQPENANEFKTTEQTDDAEIDDEQA